MKATALHLPTFKEAPADAEVVSHKLMTRAGMIRKLAGGIYTYMPLGLRVIRRIEAIIREEMDAAGAIELLMPVIQPAELWMESGRWEEYGPELLRIRDRHQRDFVIQPTSEEVVTDLARQRLEPLGLAPKQVGLMAFVDSRTKASQREIASGMRVAPSLVVTLVDQLEALKAVTRIRRPGDRRVQEISLTEVGRKLLSEALVVVRALDENLTAHLADGDRRALDRTLEAVENGHWLPDSMGRGSAD